MNEALLNFSSLERIWSLFTYYPKWIFRFSDRIKNLNKSNSFHLSVKVAEDFEALEETYLICLSSNNYHEYAFASSLLWLLHSPKKVLYIQEHCLKYLELHSFVVKETTAVVELKKI